MRRRRLLLLAAGVVAAGATVAYAATVGLTSDRLTVLSADAPTTTTSTSTTTSTTTTTVPDNAMTITLANGGTAKKATLDDSVVITFKPSVKPSTFCSSWTGTATSFNLGTATDAVKIRIVDGGTSNDTLTVSGFGVTCSDGFRLGTIDLGSTSYVSGGNAEFYGNGNDKSSVVWTPPVAPSTTGTMEIVLGTLKSGTPGTVASPTATFTPDANLRDVNNNPVTGTATTTSTF